MIELWAKHDVEFLNCDGTPCSWYTGTSTSISMSVIDEWSVWTHELGHAQNISHQSVDVHYRLIRAGAMITRCGSRNTPETPTSAMTFAA